MTLPDEVKQQMLRTFHQKVVTPGWHFTGSGPNEKDRQVLVDFADVILRGPGEFAKPTGSRLELTEVLVYERPEDGKMHAEVVFEIDMAEGASSV